MSVELTVEQLRDHARKLDAIADSGREAVRAAEYVGTQGQAFGVLCSFVGEALAPAQDAGAASARAAVGMTSGLADIIRDVARGFEITDQVVSEAFDFLRGT